MDHHIKTDTQRANFFNFSKTNIRISNLGTQDVTFSDGAGAILGQVLCFFRM